MGTAKYNIKSIDESNQLQSQDTLTAVIISTASLNKNRKNRKTFPRQLYHSKPSASSCNPQRNPLNHNNDPQNHNNCGCCGAKGHKSLECRSSRNVVCSKCNIKGHFTNKCKTSSWKHTRLAETTHWKHPPSCR